MSLFIFATTQVLLGTYLFYWLNWRVAYAAMFVDRYVRYSISKQNMMTFRVEARWAKMTSPGGQASSTGMPPNQKSKQS